MENIDHWAAQNGYWMAPPKIKQKMFLEDFKSKDLNPRLKQMLKKIDYSKQMQEYEAARDLLNI